MNSKPILTLEDAKRIAAAADAEANQNDWRVVIAVVDDGGHLLYLQRSHDTQFGSVETALKKTASHIPVVRTAALCFRARAPLLQPLKRFIGIPYRLAIGRRNFFRR